MSITSLAAAGKKLTQASVSKAAVPPVFCTDRPMHCILAGLYFRHIRCWNAAHRGTGAAVQHTVIRKIAWSFSDMV